MTDDVIATIEYESMILGRHLAGLPGRSRRTGGVLDQSAYTLLSILQAGGAASIGELSTITGLDVSTLHRQTAVLLRERYAERIADPAGGIARKFRITARGDRTLREEREGSRAGMLSLVDEWSGEDRAAFAEFLRRMNHEIERASGRAWPRPRRPEPRG